MAGVKQNKPIPEEKSGNEAPDSHSNASPLPRDTGIHPGFHSFIFFPIQNRQSNRSPQPAHHRLTID
jgi:hypothetical protein